MISVVQFSVIKIFYGIFFVTLFFSENLSYFKKTYEIKEKLNIIYYFKYFRNHLNFTFASFPSEFKKMCTVLNLLQFNNIFYHFLLLTISFILKFILLFYQFPVSFITFYSINLLSIFKPNLEIKIIKIRALFYIIYNK